MIGGFSAACRESTTQKPPESEDHLVRPWLFFKIAGISQVLLMPADLTTLYAPNILVRVIWHRMSYFATELLV